MTPTCLSERKLSRDLKPKDKEWIDMFVKRGYPNQVMAEILAEQLELCDFGG